MFVACLHWLPTNSLSVKTGILKFNEVFNLQVCKLMLNTLRGFEVDHSCFTPVSMVHAHNTRHSKNNNFVVERPRTGLDLNSFRYLDPKLWSIVHENFKNLKKKNSLSTVTKDSCWASMLSEFGMLWICKLCYMWMLLNCVSWYLSCVYLSICLVTSLYIYTNIRVGTLWVKKTSLSNLKLPWVFLSFFQILKNKYKFQT